MDGLLTRAAERMAAFASARDSFARARAALRELAGWTLDRESLRPLTHGTARRRAAARPDRNDAARFARGGGFPSSPRRSPRPDRNDAARFARGGGVVEVAIDAGQANAVGGWRDVTAAVVCKRTLGPPASADGWENRKVPAPTVRAVVASIEDSKAFADRVRAETDRLGATTAADGTVPADGAEWIWNLAGDVRPQAAGVLDFFHVAERIADAATAIRPAGEHADGLFAGGRAAVRAGGKAGREGWIGAAFGVRPAGSDGEPLRAPAADIAPHREHLGYADRLVAGRSIGSGQVEGAIEQLVNRRRKRTGGRWRAEHVGPLVEWIARVDSPDWHDIWTAA